MTIKISSYGEKEGNMLLIKCLRISLLRKQSSGSTIQTSLNQNFPRRCRIPFIPTLSRHFRLSPWKRRLKNFVSLGLWFVFREVLLAFSQKYIHFDWTHVVTKLPTYWKHRELSRDLWHLLKLQLAPFSRRRAQETLVLWRTPTLLVSSWSCFHGKRILGKSARRGRSAVEVLHGGLFLGQPQELLADGFDERGRGVAGLEVFCGAGGVSQAGALQPPVWEVPGGSWGLPAWSPWHLEQRWRRILLMSEHVWLKNMAEVAVLPTQEQDGKSNSNWQRACSQDFVCPSPTRQLSPPLGSPGTGLESGSCGKIVQGRAIQWRNPWT